MKIKTKTIIGSSMSDVKADIEKFMKESGHLTIKEIESHVDLGNYNQCGVSIRYTEEEVAE